MSSRPPRKTARPPKARSRHPVNQAMLDEAPLGSRIADVVTGFMGSWRFIIIQTIIVAIWVLGNLYLLFHFDPYPFIFLNLAFSTQAAYAAPLILLASNRAAVRDRLTLEHAADQSDVEEKQNERLLTGNTEILKKVEALEERILDLEKNILAAVGGKGAQAGDAKETKDTKDAKPPSA
jgi:uncharacterized membrane protein